jgi:hypothetical protein
MSGFVELAMTSSSLQVLDTRSRSKSDAYISHPLVLLIDARGGVVGWGTVGLIPDGVTRIFYYDPGVDSASNKNE